MYVVGNPILNDEKCVIQLAFPPYTIVDYRSFRLYIKCRMMRMIWDTAPPARGSRDVTCYWKAANRGTATRDDEVGKCCPVVPDRSV